MISLRVSTYGPSQRVPSQIFLWLDDGRGHSDYVGGASLRADDHWHATIITDPTGSIDPQHQRHVGRYETASDAMLALLCCEGPVVRALAGSDARS